MSSDTYQNQSIFSDKNFKESLKYAYANRVVNTNITDSTISNQLTTMTSLISSIVADSKVNILIEDSWNVSDISVKVNQQLVNNITSTYTKFLQNISKMAIDRSLEKIANNDLDNSTSIFSEEQLKGGQGSDKDMSADQGVEQERKESADCTGLAWLSPIKEQIDLNYQSSNEVNQQVSSDTQILSETILENQEFNTAFDVALETLNAAITKTKNETKTIDENITEVRNTANSEINITIRGSHDIHGIVIDVSQQGQNNINAVTLVNNILTSDVDDLSKAIVLDIIGVINQTDSKSNTETDFQQASSTSMEAVQKNIQTAVSSSTGKIIMTIIVILIVTGMAIAVWKGGSREFDAIFNPNGTVGKPVKTIEIAGW